MRHVLYRFYGVDGQLLYVGITKDPPSRLGQHAADKEWWTDVSGITFEWYPDRDSVLAAEARAVKVENPKYNIMLRRRPEPPLPPPAPGEKLLTWVCEACGDEIEDRTGYVHIRMDEVRAREQADIAREVARRHREDEDQFVGGVENLAEWLAWDDDHPTARWRVHHHSCDPAADSGDYWVGVERLRTLPRVFETFIHVSGKRWIDATSWHGFIFTEMRRNGVWGEVS